MAYSYYFDKNIFGTKASNIFIDQQRLLSNTSPSSIEDMLYIDNEQLKLLVKLIGIEIASFPKDKWINVYRALLNEKLNINSVPWKQIIPKDEFLETTKAFVSNIINQIESKDLKYLKTHEEYEFLFKKLKQARINANNCFKYLEIASPGQKELIKSFLPNEGYGKSPQYSTLDTITGRLSILSGPNILLLKKDYRDVLESRFGTEGKIVYLDFSSLEPRVLMAISNLDRAKGLPQDIYAKFKEEMGLENLDRNTVKIALISQLYGANEETLYRQLEKKISDPEEFISSIQDYFGIEKTRTFLKEQFINSGNKHIQNYYGRYITCPDVKPYVLLNYYIQSTAVDVALQGFTKIIKKIYSAQLQDIIVPMFVLHDALILDVHQDAYDAIPKLCKLGSTKIKGFEDINFFLKEEKIK